ncbi:hypothetical protein GCM10027082_47360 [Comamonas humi]
MDANPFRHLRVGHTAIHDTRAPSISALENPYCAMRAVVYGTTCAASWQKIWHT